MGLSPGALVVEQRERTATELRAAIADGRMSARSVVERAVADAAETGGALNAFITRDPAAADRVTDADRPLTGLAFSVKDTLEIAGMPATAGSRLLLDHRPRRSAPIVERLVAAGAVVLGKSNCAEFGIGDLECWSPVGGQTRNPWSPTATPGGSSGGDAAAVAAGIAAFGVGSDYGGSIRFPAHCTGIAALRPTIGRLPHAGQLPQLAADPPPVRRSRLQAELQTPGLLARSVDDLRMLLRVLSPGTEQPVRRAVWFAADAMPEVAEAVRLAADVLAATGVEVAECADPGIAEAAAILAGLRAEEGMPEIEWWARGREDLLGPVVRRQLERPLAAPDPDLPMRAAAVRQAALAALGSAEVLLAPVAAEPAFPIVVGEQPDRSHLDRASRWVTLLGWPAVVVPVATAASGLPIGVQIVARAGEDETALAAAARIERELGRWTGTESAG